METIAKGLVGTLTKTIYNNYKGKLLKTITLIIPKLTKKKYIYTEKN